LVVVVLLLVRRRRKVLDKSKERSGEATDIKEWNAHVCV